MHQRSQAKHFSHPGPFCMQRKAAGRQRDKLQEEVDMKVISDNLTVLTISMSTLENLL